MRLSLAPIILLGLSAACSDVRVAPFVRAPDAASSPCPGELVGFATLDGGTTGGGPGEHVSVSNLADFQAAVARTIPLTVEVTGTLTLTGQVAVASDKTILGAPATLLGGGLDLTDSHNVIVRDLTIARAAGTDAITLLRSKHIWIDHCDLSSDEAAAEGTYDGLVDITHATDDVTISWTHFHDHRDVSLVGHSADNGAEDRGHLTVTYHHDLFERVKGAAPRARFGSIHVFNNHYVDVSGYAVASVMGATALVERSVFENVPLPITTMYVDPDPGSAADAENVYVASGPNQITMPMPWTPPYPYTPDSAGSVPALLAACVGPGHL